MAMGIRSGDAARWRRQSARVPTAGAHPTRVVRAVVKAGRRVPVPSTASGARSTRARSGADGHHGTSRRAGTRRAAQIPGYTIAASGNGREAGERQSRHGLQRCMVGFCRRAPGLHNNSRDRFRTRRVIPAVSPRRRSSGASLRQRCGSTACRRRSTPRRRSSSRGTTPRRHTSSRRQRAAAPRTSCPWAARRRDPACSRICAAWARGMHSTR